MAGIKGGSLLTSSSREDNIATTSTCVVDLSDVRLEKSARRLAFNF